MIMDQNKRELVIAWANGEEIEQKHEQYTAGKWVNFDGDWGQESTQWEFRIKPKSDFDICIPYQQNGISKNILIRFDGKTDECKSARLEGLPDPLVMETMLKRISSLTKLWEAEIEVALRVPD